jgi:hypothetical protein
MATRRKLWLLLQRFLRFVGFVGLCRINNLSFFNVRGVFDSDPLPLQICVDLFSGSIADPLDNPSLYRNAPRQRLIFSSIGVRNSAGKVQAPGTKFAACRKTNHDAIRTDSQVSHRFCFHAYRFQRDWNC